MKYLNYYQKDKALPQILEMLKKEGYNVTPDNIKSCSTPTMMVGDVLRGIGYIKSNGLGNIIVYTNKVSLKDKISEDYEIVILDIEDLSKIALKQKNYEIYDSIN
jgi:hypothetical protein